MQDTRTWETWDMCTKCYWTVYYKTLPLPQTCDICGEKILRYIPPIDFSNQEWLGSKHLGVTCMSTTITPHFDPFKEYPELFPETKPTALPPLRPGFDHQIPINEGATWTPKWRPVYHK